jgi:hypothetical protein
MKHFPNKRDILGLNQLLLLERDDCGSEKTPWYTWKVGLSRKKHRLLLVWIVTRAGRWTTKKENHN